MILISIILAIGSDVPLDSILLQFFSSVHVGMVEKALGCI